VIVVPDASALLACFLPGPGNAAADRLLASEAAFHAPDLLKPDLAEALRRAYESRTIAAAHIPLVFAELDRIVAHWHPVHDLVPDALAQAIALDHPLADLLYPALARRLKARFVTANERLLAVLPYGSATTLEAWDA
jgi:predicted nucleic acid-binding protein